MNTALMFDIDISVASVRASLYFRDSVHIARPNPHPPYRRGRVKTTMTCFHRHRHDPHNGKLPATCTSVNIFEMTQENAIEISVFNLRY